MPVPTRPHVPKAPYRARSTRWGHICSRRHPHLPRILYARAISRNLQVCRRQRLKRQIYVHHFAIVIELRIGTCNCTRSSFFVGVFRSIYFGTPAFRFKLYEASLFEIDVVQKSLNVRAGVNFK